MNKLSIIIVVLIILIFSAFIPIKPETESLEQDKIFHYRLIGGIQGHNDVVKIYSDKTVDFEFKDIDTTLSNEQNIKLQKYLDEENYSVISKPLWFIVLDKYGTKYVKMTDGLHRSVRIRIGNETILIEEDEFVTSFVKELLTEKDRLLKGII